MVLAISGHSPLGNNLRLGTISILRVSLNGRENPMAGSVYNPPLSLPKYMQQ